MKHIISVAIIMLMFVGGSFAKDRVSKHDTVKNNLISITYGRPSMKGRAIFGDGGLVPSGQVWRLGADEATQITFAKDCKFGDKQVKAGTYTLFAKPFSGEWIFILNSKLGQWGAYEYDKVKDDNVAETSGLVKHTDKAVETFTISLSNDGITFSWEKTSAFVAVKAY